MKEVVWRSQFGVWIGQRERWSTYDKALERVLGYWVRSDMMVGDDERGLEGEADGGTRARI